MQLRKEWSLVFLNEFKTFYCRLFLDKVKPSEDETDDA